MNEINGDVNQPNGNQGASAGENTDSESSGENVSDLKDTTFTFVPKVLAPTPDEEKVAEADAMTNAKNDANKYANVEQNPVVTMVIKDYGTVKMELYPKVAPESVENFISLINKNVYDGLIFHRTIPGFMAQGGDPEGNGSGGPDYSIVGEFSVNGITNDLSHVRGLLSMARSSENNSAGSQFFIVTTDSTYLDGSYAGFGRVLEGMDVVDKVVNVEVLLRDDDIDISKIATIEEYIELMSKCDRPVNPPVIESMTVDTFGVTYDEPEKIRQEIAE
ncbi:MAG: peptidylprolyl isomerase [Clostridia bacterium]|nr:peptidylprolyl isomerase [Clostridia bacterium]